MHDPVPAPSVRADLRTGAASDGRAPAEDARSGRVPPGSVEALPDGLTVGQVSARLGVTVRALHHWDQVGLARPSLRTPAGYRLYTAADVERLTRILAYREVGLGLDGIRAVLDDAATDVPAALRAQREQVAERIERLRRLDASLERMIDAHEGGLLLTAEQQASILGPDWNPEWPAKARAEYGDTTQWRQYAERSANRSPEEWAVIAEAVAGLDRAMASAMDAGVEPGSPEADRLVERHREVFAAYFPLSRQMQVCLARRYEADPEFTAHYDRIRAGLAGWFRRSVDASARAHGVDPDRARWE